MLLITLLDLCINLDQTACYELWAHPRVYPSPTLFQRVPMKTLHLNVEPL